jgi:hypothetical protein
MSGCHHSHAAAKHQAAPYGLLLCSAHAVEITYLLVQLNVATPLTPCNRPSYRNTKRPTCQLRIQSSIIEQLHSTSSSIRQAALFTEQLHVATERAAILSPTHSQETTSIFSTYSDKEIIAQEQDYANTLASYALTVQHPYRVPIIATLTQRCSTKHLLVARLATQPAAVLCSVYSREKNDLLNQSDVASPLTPCNNSSYRNTSAQRIPTHPVRRGRTTSIRSRLQFRATMGRINSISRLGRRRGGAIPRRFCMVLMERRERDYLRRYCLRKKWKRLAIVI